MKLSTCGMLCALAGIIPFAAASAQETSFLIKPIKVPGSENVQATAINGSGAIAATVYAHTTNAPSGVVIAGKTVTTLPPVNDPDFGGFHASAIDDAGNVLGWAFRTSDGVPDMFFFQGGAYNSNYEFPLVGIGNADNEPPNPIGLNKRGDVFFTYFIDVSAPTDGAYGLPPKFRNVPALNRYNTIESINASTMVAGTSYTLSGADQVFAGRGKNFTSLTPPGANSVKGGYINDKGDIAGTWRDASNVWHGFVYAGGAYTSFDMPEAANSIAVTGINASGRVVGTYVSTADSHQHGFLYNGTTVSEFGKYGQFDNVTIAVNRAGKLIVSNQLLGSTPKYRSYSVTCSGPGC